MEEAIGQAARRWRGDEAFGAPYAVVLVPVPEGYGGWRWVKCGGTEMGQVWGSQVRRRVRGDGGEEVYACGPPQYLQSSCAEQLEFVQPTSHWHRPLRHVPWLTPSLAVQLLVSLQSPRPWMRRHP